MSVNVSFLKGFALRKVLLQNYLFNKKGMKADLAELGAGGLLQLKYCFYDYSNIVIS